MTTEVIKKEVNYNRTGYLKIIDSKIIFDTSDEEYGPVKISLKLLKDKIKEHESKK